MTAYLTSSDLDTFLGAEITSLTAGGLTPERYAQTIADINDEVNGYVGPRILASVPNALKHHACAMARFRLHKDKVSERMKQDLDIALKFFAKVEAGTWALPLADDPATAENESAGAGGWFSAQPSRFTGRGY
jgi:phage gp36-like protein